MGSKKTNSQLAEELEGLSSKVTLINPLVEIIRDKKYDIPDLLSSAASSNELLVKLSKNLEINTNTLTSFRTEFQTHKLEFQEFRGNISKDLETIKSQANSNEAKALENLNRITTLEGQVTNLTNLHNTLSADFEAFKLTNANFVNIKVPNLEAQLKSQSEQFVAYKAKNVDNIKSAVSTHMDKKSLPFALKARIDQNDKMVTIRGIKRDTFSADAHNIEIVTRFMSNMLGMNNREIDKHHPIQVTFNNRGNTDETPFLVVTFSSRETRNFVLSRSRNIPDKDIFMFASLPLEYRKIHQDFRARMADIRAQFRANGENLNTRFDFDDAGAYTCSYRVQSSTGSFDWNVLDSYTPPAIINTSRSKESLKPTPEPKDLKRKLIKIMSKESNVNISDLESAVKDALTTFVYDKEVNTSGRKAYIVIQDDHMNEALTLAKAKLTNHEIIPI